MQVHGVDWTDDPDYCECLNSKRTQALFLGLALLFLFLFAWRVGMVRLDALAIVFGCFFLIFIFYVLNYRTLVIQLTRSSLRLLFGIFHLTVPVENIASCEPDEIPGLMRNGGAGIHFMFIHGRYRASFNFLEYPRVVVALRQKVGLVRDVSFSTRQPDEVIRLVRQLAALNR